MHRGQPAFQHTCLQYSGFQGNVGGIPCSESAGVRRFTDAPSCWATASLWGLWCFHDAAFTCKLGRAAEWCLLHKSSECFLTGSFDPSLGIMSSSSSHDEQCSLRTFFDCCLVPSNSHCSQFQVPGPPLNCIKRKRFPLFPNKSLHKQTKTCAILPDQRHRGASWTHFHYWNSIKCHQCHTQMQCHSVKWISLNRKQGNLCLQRE